MSERDEQELASMGEQQGPSPADADTTDQDVAITGNEGTPGAERLGIRPSAGGVVGDPRAPASADATRGVAGARSTDTSSAGLAGTGAAAGTGDVDASATGLVGAGRGATGGQSGVLGTRSGTDRSDVPGGLSGGMDSGDVTDTGGQADGGQEGANVQP